LIIKPMASMPARIYMVTSGSSGRAADWLGQQAIPGLTQPEDHRDLGQVIGKG
jgi:hypothetical protein